MTLTRRCFVHLAAGAVSIHALPRAVRAQAYPTRPITVMVFVGAGGTPDIIARLIGQALTQRLGQSVLVENRPGAGGNLALQAVARAPAEAGSYGRRSSVRNNSKWLDAAAAAACEISRCDG